MSLANKIYKKNNLNSADFLLLFPLMSIDLG